MTKIFLFFGSFVLGATVCGVAYYMYKKGRKSVVPQIDGSLDGIKPEEVDKLNMSDVVAYFRGFQPKKGVDVPFIANAEAPQVRDILKNVSYPTTGTTFILGSLNENTNNIENCRLIVAKEVGKDVVEAMGQDSLIVLS